MGKQIIEGVSHSSSSDLKEIELFVSSSKGQVIIRLKGENAKKYEDIFGESIPGDVHKPKNVRIVIEDV